jgi:hypothetical protein
MLKYHILMPECFFWRGGRYRVIVTKTGFFVVIKTIPHILWVLLMLDSSIAVKAE